MGRIPLNFDVDPSAGRTERAPRLPAGFGMAPQAAKVQQGRAIARQGLRTADVAADYAAKNRQADQRADVMAYKSNLAAVQQEMQRQLAETSDPRRVRDITEKSWQKIDSWVAGKNDKGVPNIRWNSQRSELQQATAVFQNEFRLAAEQRIAEIGKRDTNTKAKQAQYDAEMSGNREQIAEAVQVRVKNGTLTAEEGQVEKRSAFLRSDLILAKNNIISIEQMQPDQAAEAAKTFEEGLTAREKGEWVAFEHIPEADRKTLVRLAKDAAATAKKRAAEQEKARQAESNSAVVEFIQQNGRLPGAGERAGMELTAETTKTLESGRLERISPALEPAAAIAMRKEMLEYNPDEDEDKSKLLNYARRIEGFSSPATKNFLKDVLRRATDQEGSAVDKLVDTEIEDVITGLDYRTGFGDRFKDNEKLQIIAREKDLYNQWVKENNPSVEQRLKYLDSGRIGSIKAAKNKDEFIRRAWKQDRFNFQPPALNHTQAGYLEDDSSLLKLIGEKNADTDQP